MKFRQQLGKYLFEVVVIFIGITLGFIFDEWRGHRDELARKRALYESIHEELVKTRDLLQKTDSLNDAFTREIAGMLADTMSHGRALEQLDNLTTDFYINMDGALATLESLTQQGAVTFTSNHVIAENISYINSIALDHTTLVAEFRQRTSKTILPCLARYGVVDDLIEYNYSDNDVKLAGDYDGLMKDKEFRAELKILLLKRASLSIIYQTLIRDLDRILAEIEKEK